MIREQLLVPGRWRALCCTLVQHWLWSPQSSERFKSLNIVLSKHTRKVCSFDACDSSESSATVRYPVSDEWWSSGSNARLRAHGCRNKRERSSMRDHWFVFLANQWLFCKKQTEKLSYLPDLQRALPRHSLRVWTGRRKRPEERTYPQWRTNSQIKCRFWPEKIIQSQEVDYWIFFKNFARWNPRLFHGIIVILLHLFFQELRAF